MLPQGGDLQCLAVNCQSVCSAVCLRFPIPLAKDFSWLLTTVPQCNAAGRAFKADWSEFKFTSWQCHLDL